MNFAPSTKLVSHSQTFKRQRDLHIFDKALVGVLGISSGTLIHGPVGNLTLLLYHEPTKLHISDKAFVGVLALVVV